MRILSRASLSQYLMIGGIFGIVAGLIHLFSGLTSEFTPIIIGDMVFNTLLGLLSLLAAWLLKNGKQIVLLVIAVEMIGAIVYAFAMGRGVNYFAIVIGAFLLWQLYALKNQGELT
ncbi:hypothetical protein [Candidatus Leptofilum sp.]|uniref:hypothetical protein n=1 Tax=Candidatus Leptofilum sp. TaxID=3241576 RepID=UPI003B5CBBB8